MESEKKIVIRFKVGNFYVNGAISTFFLFFVNTSRHTYIGRSIKNDLHKKSGVIKTLRSGNNV